MTDKHYMEISTKCLSYQSMNVETGGRGAGVKITTLRQVLTVSLSGFARSLHLYDSYF